MARIMEQLDELVETGFRGRGAGSVLAMINELNRIETDTDLKSIDLLSELFAHEDEIDPVSLMVWHRLIRWVGDLADYSEKVGNRLRLLIARK
jgi:predicted phosphate transport protein (TIGR00153 family)